MRVAGKVQQPRLRLQSGVTAEHDLAAGEDLLQAVPDDLEAMLAASSGVPVEVIFVRDGRERPGLRVVEDDQPGVVEVEGAIVIQRVWEPFQWLPSSFRLNQTSLPPEPLPSSAVKRFSTVVVETPSRPMAKVQ